nr:L174 [uncultured bacterium]
MLGEQEVNFNNDRDRIEVKRRAGPYRQLRIEVRDAPIEIREMIVTFGDHKTFRPNIRAQFRDGRGSQVIDLPGNRRSIDGVEFVYRSINRRQGRGRVLLYAR